MTDRGFGLTPTRPAGLMPAGVAAALVAMLASGCELVGSPEQPFEPGGRADAHWAIPPGIVDAGALPRDLVTWHGHIRPLVDAHCRRCHQVDSVSGLDFGEDAWLGTTPPWWAGRMVNAVSRGHMPPRTTAFECRPVVDRTAFGDAEVDLFVAWSRDGFLEGEPVEHPEPEVRALPDAIERWEAGEPYVPAFSGGVDRRCLLVGAAPDAPVWLRGFDVVTDHPRMLRRAAVYVVDPAWVDAVVALDAGAPGPGYPCALDPGVAGYRPLGLWLPGDGPFVLPRDHAFEVPAGGRLVLGVQYSADAISGDVPADGAALDLWVADEAPIMRVEAVELLHTDLLVPAERRLTQGRDFPIDVDGTLIGAWGRMGSAGTRLSLSRAPADGGEDCILDVPAFDPDWVDSWRFAPNHWLPILPGDEVRLRCTHDNRLGPSPAVWSFEPDGERCDATLLIARPVAAVGGNPQCSAFAPCVRDCIPVEGADPDPVCFARCHAVGQHACSGCLLQATGTCALELCAERLQALGACMADCEEGTLECIVTQCVDPFDDVTRCVWPSLVDETCTAHLDACGARFAY